MNQFNIMCIKVVAVILSSVWTSSGNTDLGRPLTNAAERFEEWPKVTLKLSANASLKEIFDSGLRPYRFPALESGLLEAKHFRVSLQIAGQQKLPEFPVEHCKIKVLGNGEISNLEFTSPRLSFDKSQELYSPWMRFSDHTTEDLESFFAFVKANPMFWRSQSANEDARRGSPIIWKIKSDVNPALEFPAFIHFSRASGSKTPLRLRLGFPFGNIKPMASKTYYRVPVPPPPGYENVSMDAPKNFGPDSPPKESLEVRREEFLKLRESHALKRDSIVKEPEKLTKVKAQKDDAYEEVTAQPEKKHLPWIIVGLIVVVMLMFLLKARKNKVT